MSDVFEGYERQYCELSANLSRKCTAAGAVDGEQKKQKVSEIKSGIDEAESLASADQRTRLMMSTERLGKSGDRIKDSRRTMLETEELGVSILQDLHSQRQSLLHAHNTLHGVDDNIGKSKRIMTAMSRRMSRNKLIIGSIVAVLVIAIILILYFKLAK
ncbi:hypothetical protein I3843_04G014600 [Carya illinoinensis]|nr:hypothetical protein I3843_04G014600 [Carya illinoinensis]KAG7981775.1 hypothetical protein I3843_04G014600 [Carya illinoinensis]